MSASEWGPTGPARWAAMTEFIVTAIRGADPTVAPATIEESLGRHASVATARCRVAEELRDHPHRLTVDDPHTTPVLARVVVDLRAAGHNRFVQPSCPSCGRPRTYGYPSTGGTRVCGTCHPSPTEICAWCGRERRVARRLPDGTGLCSTCRTRETSKFERCGACGRERWVATRDKEGQAYCHPCYKGRIPDRTGRWVGDAGARRVARTAAIVDVVRRVAPEIPAQDLEDWLDAHVAAAGGHAPLANWLLDHPDALTSGDNTAPPVVVKLLDELRSRGAGVTRPRCASCGRDTTRLPHCTEGGRICPTCFRAHTAEQCGQCGITEGVQRRLADGTPLCSRCAEAHRKRVVCAACGRTRLAGGTLDGLRVCGTCRRRDPRSHEDCRECGRRRPVSARHRDGGAICPNCAHRARTAPCFLCGHDRPVSARVDGNPYCARCRPRRPQQCSRCGDHRVCYRLPTPEELRPPGGEFFTVLCGACLARERLTVLLAGPGGAVAPYWVPLIDTLLQSPTPSVLLEWIRDRSTARLLHDLAQRDQPPTHADLDLLAVTSRYTAEQARALLEAAGLLDPHDTRRNRIAARAQRRIGHDAHAEDRLLLGAYVRWSLLPALERRAQLTRTPIASRNISDLAVVIAYLNYLRRHGLTLKDKHQHRFDLWIGRHRSHRAPLRRFLVWAVRNRYSSPVAIPMSPRRDAREFISDDERRTLIGTALTGSDADWTLTDRFAVLLVLLYGQTPLRIASLTRAHVTTQPGGGVQLRLGRDPIDLLPPVAALARQLLGQQALTQPLRDLPSLWLYPGHSAGRHLHPATLARRLRHLGAPARAAHNTTLLDLAQSAPSAVLADLLGMHLSTIESWGAASGARWAQYAGRDLPPQPHASRCEVSGLGGLRPKLVGPPS